MRERALALLLTLGVLVLPSVTSAQALGTIAGTVKDASGAVLPGVTVEAAEPGAHRESANGRSTDGSGQYRIVNLPPGTYTVTFTLPGFSTVKRDGVEVSPNFTSNVDAEHARRRGRGDHHGHRREPDRRHPVGGADAGGDRRSVQGTAVRRLVDPDGRARAGRPRVATWTSAACSAIRPARRSRRTAAAPATACR